MKPSKFELSDDDLAHPSLVLQSQMAHNATLMRQAVLTRAYAYKEVGQCDNGSHLTLNDLSGSTANIICTSASRSDGMAISTSNSTTYTLMSPVTELQYQV